MQCDAPGRRINKFYVDEVGEVKQNEGHIFVLVTLSRYTSSKDGHMCRLLENRYLSILIL